MKSEASSAAGADPATAGPDRRRVLAGAAAGVLIRPGEASAQASPASSTRFASILDSIAAGLRERTGGALPASRGAAVLRAIEPNGLSPEERVRLAAILPGLETEAAQEQLFPFGSPGGSPYVVHPRAGAHLRAAGLTATGSESQRAGLARDLDRETARLTADAGRGVILPALLLDRTLAAILAVQTLAGGELEAALSRQADALRTLRPRASTEIGLGRLRGGEAYYGLALSLAAGVRTSPEAAHRRGLAAVAALHARADTLLREAGLARGSVAERLRSLKRDPRHHFPASEAGKARAVAEMNARLRRTQALLPVAFARAPGAAEVRRMSPEDEAAGRAGRREPGGYVVDLIRIQDRPAWTLPSVVHHELHPGHLLQEALIQSPPHALQARYAPGYSEGWATYAEQLADELGAYQDDPLGRIGHLQWMLFRMGRLVADTGIHARGWSRDRAITELRAIQGDPIAFITIEDDVDRMIAQPGSVAGHATATLEVVRLRAASRRRLGARFDLAGFHDAVLKRGPLGTPGLEAAVALWEAGLTG